MSEIDYGQTAEDHQAFLILVRHTGQHLCKRSFNRTWERIRKLSCVTIPGQTRKAWVSYKRIYSKDNNDWGDFQAHRKVLGLISIGRCSDAEQFEELFDSYRKVKEEYATSLFNSRLFVFGMNTDGSAFSEEEKAKYEQAIGEMFSSSSSRNGKASPVHSEDSGVTPDLSPTEIGDSANTDVNKATTADVEPPSTQKICDINSQSESETRQSDNEQILSSSKLVSPTTEARTSRAHSNNLTKETTGAEVLFRPSLEACTDLEEKVKDFVTSLFFVLEGKRLDRSFERADKMQLLCAPFEKKDYVGLDTDTKSYRKKCQGRLRKHLADLCLQAGIPGEAILHYQTAIDILRPVNDWLWIGACYEGICSASVIVRFPKRQFPTMRRNFSLQAKSGSSLANDTKVRTGNTRNEYANGLQDQNDSPKSALGPDDIVEKYREALVHYSKFKNAGMIEMEACLKACRVLVARRKYLQASDFLQNVVYINLQTSDEDKINRYCTLSQLYAQIGFERKAAFFKRIAAMQCVSPQNPRPNWSLCHSLVMQCLDGYNICLDPKDTPNDCVYGWPVLQSRVLNELIFSARRTGNIAAAVRHLCLLLHTLFDTLSTQDKRDLIATLQTLTSKCEGTYAPLALDNGTILPPVPLSNIPQVRSFKLIPLPPNLEPVKISSGDVKLNTGPFIFTPLSLGQAESQSLTHVDFSWVERDLCEVQLQVYNPLPEDLNIKHMSLMSDGVDIEAYPTNLTIQGESRPHLVKILIRPRSSGDLSIHGYSTHLLGVKSHCRFKDLPALRDLRTCVTVVAALPQISLTTSLPKVMTFTSIGDGANVVTSGTASIYAGQSKDCMITLRNTSTQPVERISVSLDSQADQKELLSRVFQWSPENINSQLPLQPSGIICFTVCIYGSSDFLPNRATRSGSQSSDHSNPDESQSKCVEALLCVEYSGGAGLEAGYCRRCSVALSVDILPSVIFHSWEALPSESPDHCVLAFDVCNVCNQDIELQYNTNDKFTLEPKQIRRLTLQIEKCKFPDPVPELDVADRLQLTKPPPPVICPYSQHLDSFIHILWSMCGTKTFGMMGAEHLSWSSQQLELIRVSDLSWNVSINEQRCSAHSVPVVCTGKVVHIEILVTFHAGVSYASAVLMVSCDLLTDHVCVHSADQATVLGSRSLRLSNVRGDDSAHFTMSYLFHYSGTYRFNFKCVVTATGEDNAHIWKCHDIYVRVIDEE